MKVVRETDGYIVLDDFLAADAFDLLWEFVQSSRYYRDPEWHRSWDIVDLPPWRSETHRCDGPNRTGFALDLFWENILSSKFYRKNFNCPFNSESYLHPPGSSLDWHHDAEAYVGAYAYYTHKHWHASWGGELMVIEDRLPLSDLPDRRHMENGEVVTVKGFSDSIHRQDLSALLMNGTTSAQFVFPKPNRMVMMKGGHWHKVSLVKSNAPTPRCSIAGFFLGKQGQGSG